MIKTTPEERLAEMLDARDERIAELESELSVAENQLAGAADGWRFNDIPADDKETLPVPRLELLYVQKREWYDYEVVYRMVLRHLTGHLYSLAIGYTRCGGNSGNHAPDGVEELPFRSGADAHHDSAFLGMPLFKVMPGKKPVLLENGYERQRDIGRKHRRA